jgi:hypothetical protein
LTGIILVLALGAVLLIIVQQAVAPKSRPEPINRISQSEPMSQTKTISWRFVDAGTDPYNVPNTTVITVVDAKEYNLGTYDASCREIAEGVRDMYGKLALPGQLSPRAECWYGGGGYELGIFQEGLKFVAKVAVLYEGSAEVAGGKGEFKTVVEIR